MQNGFSHSATKTADLTFAFNVHTKNVLIHSWNKEFVFMILYILPREGNNLIQARLGFFQ